MLQLLGYQMTCGIYCIYLPDPLSNTGVHSSSSSALQPEPAPEKTRSSSTPGKPDAGV